MSRIIISFNNNSNLKFNQHHLQSLVYSLIDSAGFRHIHDLPIGEPRFFNFSQLFKTRKGHLNLIITSPNDNLIINIDEILQKYTKLKLNGHLLNVTNTKVIQKESNLTNIKIKTETPIIVRIPKENFRNYQLVLEKDYPYFYWRPLKNVNIPLDPFVKQLESRIYKLYKIYYENFNIPEKSIFETFNYIKSIDFPYNKNGNKIHRIGTLWEFKPYACIDGKLINFILDTGLGELTSQGYGFVNLIRIR